MNLIIRHCAMLCPLYLAAMPVAQAEDVYISDRLRVGVRPQPGQQFAPTNVVVTGMKLKVLAHKNGFIQIRSESGIKGWIKDTYVINKPPAELQLKELQKSHQKLGKDLDKANETIDAMEKAQVVLNEKIDHLKVQRAELQRSQAILTVTDPDRGLWWLVILLVGLVGVTLGYLWHRYQTMRRLGGLRV